MSKMHRNKVGMIALKKVWYTTPLYLSLIRKLYITHPRYPYI